MNVIKDTWRQLVGRRLWPVALLMLGALVAVPLLLAKSPEAPPAEPVAKVSADDARSSFVTVAAETTERRRVLGAEKDPFEPKALPKAKKKKVKAAASQQAADPTSGGSQENADAPSAGGSSGGGAPSAPTAPPLSPAPTPTATVPKYSIKVRFGKTDEQDLKARNVERLSVLPDEEAPVLVYSGVEDGGKVAIFELTGKVDAQGDGKCEPTPEDCQYLKLRAGETEFITVTDTGEETDAQYQLDLVKIYTKTTKVAAEDDASEAEPLVKASSSRLNGKRARYVFDAKTGTLHRRN